MKLYISKMIVEINSFKKSKIDFSFVKNYNSSSYLECLSGTLKSWLFFLF